MAERFSNPATDRDQPSDAFEPVQRFRLSIIEGDQSGTQWSSTTDQCSIGSHQHNDLVLEDRTISRFHCEIRISDTGAMVRDLGSTNGTFLDGVQVAEAYLRNGSTIRLGRASLRFEADPEKNRIPLSDKIRCGSL